MGKLQQVQNAASRLVVGTQIYDRVSDHIKNLHRLPVEQRVIFKTVVLTFCCLIDSFPVYLSDFVVLYKPTRELRFKNLRNIVSPPYRLAKSGGEVIYKCCSIHLECAPSFSEIWDWPATIQVSSEHTLIYLLSLIFSGFCSLKKSDNLCVYT
jgi:hypothetical protein